MNPEPDFTWMFIKTIAGLVLVLILAFILIRFVLPKTRLARSGKDSWIQIVDRIAIDRHLNLYLVKILERYLVLGASENSLNLITEISKTDGEKIESS